MSYQYKNFSELDFDQIKESFIKYLETQSEFKDYNFKGSALNTLLNLLAYNTQYNAFYLNMNSSERFITTAQRRENVVALAKNLGYVPHSAKGAEAKIKIGVTPVKFVENELIVPKYTIFKASTEDSTFTFYTKEPYVLKYNPTTRNFVGDIVVFEGKQFTHSFIADMETAGVTLPNKNVQNDKLTVIVKSGSVTDQYFPVETFTQLDGNSKVYFVEEVVGQKTRIYFGDNIIGKKIIQGSEITITYFTTKGKLANTASRFSIAQSIPNTMSAPEIISESKASNGCDVESIESIRTNAPLNFEAQGRAVTAQDFKTILTTKLVPDIHTVSCWGGEEETPMKLGYVFLSWVTNEEIESDSGIIFRSPDMKEYIEREFREKYATVTMFPQVVDPQTLFVKIETKVYYDSTKNVSKEDIVSIVKEAVKEDYKKNYSKFQTTLRYSKLSTAIDNSSPVINSNDLKVSFFQEEGSIQTIASDGVTIGISVQPWSLESSKFSYKHGNTRIRNAYLSDSFQPNNEVALWYKDVNDNPKLWIKNVASINRQIGRMTFNSNFNFSAVEGIDEVNRFRLYALSSSKDVDFTRNIIPLLKMSDIVVDAIVD